MKNCRLLLLLVFLLPCVGWAQEGQRLLLPNREQLSAEQVLYVMQDSEGFLWYATEGGGICRDDGRQMLVFRSDAEHPNLLCSNDVACIAEAEGRYIIIGTYHGACILDKQDYSIRTLADVDKQRVDDILVGRNGHWWLTANKKIYEYSKDGQLLNIYLGGDKYIFRLHEDQQGRLWGVEWEGGTIRLDDGQIVQVSKEWPADFNFRRVVTDRQGNQLVADGFGECYALCSSEQQSWFDGQIMTRFMADSVRMARQLSSRPTALAISKAGELWFSTGKDIRVKKGDAEIVVLSDTKDVSAMAFTPNGTLWLATIFGTLMTYQDGKLTTDEYASNEYGDAVTHLEVDSLGRLVIVCNRYVRLYDPIHHTLRQQSREAAGVYSIELQETGPNMRWSEPQDSTVVERMPQWGWGILVVLIVLLSALIVYVCFLYRQRKHFMESMKKDMTGPIQSDYDKPENQTPFSDEWLQNAISQVEAHLRDDSYSVEQLACDLCVSRMTLYRKIQAATGQKPTEFMRTIRLRRAAEMLREGHLSITEISYASGFSSVSYFSRCFRAMYGVPPTQFQDKITEKGGQRSNSLQSE